MFIVVIKSEQKKWFFIGMFLVLLVLTGYMLKSYLAALAIGGLIAYFLFPVSNWLKKRLKKQVLVEGALSVGSVLILLLISGLLIVPIANQASSLYVEYDRYVDVSFEEHCPGAAVERGAGEFRKGGGEVGSLKCQALFKLSNFLNSASFKGKFQVAAQKVAAPLMNSVTDLFSFALSFLVSLIIVIFTVFYLLENGGSLKNTFVRALPLKACYKVKLVNRFKSTIDAVVKGSVVTALMQGALGALVFFILGIPLALFWGMVMVVLSFIPAVGPTIIWLPAALILFLTGSYVKGIVMVVFGFVVLGYIDNVLKPKMIGDKIKLSSFSILLGVLGGLELFGIIGLFLGPVVIALLVTFKDIYFEMSE